MMMLSVPMVMSSRWTRGSSFETIPRKCHTTQSTAALQASHPSLRHKLRVDCAVYSTRGFVARQVGLSCR